MRGIIFFSLVFLFLSCGNPVALENDYQLDKETLRKIEIACKKMGPHKQYRVLADKTLQVKVEGRWLNLKY